MAVEIDQSESAIVAGGEGTAGRLELRDASGTNRVRVDGRHGAVYLGGNGNDGDLVVYPAEGDNITLAEAAVRINGQNAAVHVGGNGRDGDIVLYPAEGNSATETLPGIHLNGQNAVVHVGGNGRDGDLVVYPAEGDNTTVTEAGVRINGQNAAVHIGGNGRDGDVVLYDAGGDNQTLSQATIHLNGSAGDIVLRRGDCAEEFRVSEHVEVGTVVVIDSDFRVTSSTRAYDRRVVGVVAGAHGQGPAILLGREQDSFNRVPVALTGRVYCKVDATVGQVGVGDLLTTADRPGHAMRASDPLRAFGAVIGKALAPLRSGVDLLPVLVALQ